MKINLSEEATQQYQTLFNEYLQAIQNLNKRVTDVFNGVMMQSRYEKLQKTIYSILNAYTNTIVKDVETGIFGTWEASDASLRACLRKQRAGDDADQVCADVEKAIGQSMARILNINKNEISITDRPVVSEDGFEKLEDICKSAQTEIQDIQSRFLAKIDTEAAENDIYGTLQPLVVRISTSIESFFEFSYTTFDKLHDFTIRISKLLQSIMEENNRVGSSNGNSGKYGSSGSAVPSAHNALKQSNTNCFKMFKKVTQTVNGMFVSEEGENDKTVTYDMIGQIADVYHEFYSEYGNYLKDDKKTNEEREAFIKKEYIELTRERGNDQYFSNGEEWTFKSHACHTYVVFDRVADMLKNVAEACKKGEANDENLLLGAYVLFDPIIIGHMEEHDKKCDDFLEKASNDILQILGINIKSLQNVEQNSYATSRNHAENKDETVRQNGNIVNGNEEDDGFVNENFSEENIQQCIKSVEDLINQFGVERFNRLIEKHYDALSNSRKTYSKKATTNQSKLRGVASNNYGRYTVTSQSIRTMEPLYQQADFYLEGIDNFYKEKFNNLGRDYDKLNAAVHGVSSLLASWGTKAIDHSQQLREKEENKQTENPQSSIWGKINLNSMAIGFNTVAGKVLNGGSQMVKLLDLAMPHFKNNKTLVKLNESFWDLTRQDIQIPYCQKMMDQYVMEHYELKYGVQNGQSGMFEHYHEAVLKLTDEHHRRALENAIFAAQTWVTPQNYTIRARTPQSVDAICLGIFLNLVRSGLCCEQDIESDTANSIVDKLYSIYVYKTGVIPRVDIDPAKRTVS